MVRITAGAFGVVVPEGPETASDAVTRCAGPAAVLAGAADVAALTDGAGEAWAGLFGVGRSPGTVGARV
ncbi:MAG: hypothetical protein ABI577_05660 [bacterium]